VLESQPELFIHVAPNKANNTITLTDSGIGMTKVRISCQEDPNSFLSHQCGSVMSHATLGSSHAYVLGCRLT